METVARIQHQDGDTFSAAVYNLTRSTLFLRSDQPMNFGDRLYVSFDDISVVGEVVFVAEDPSLPGAVVLFEAPEPIRACLRALQPSVTVLSDAQPPLGRPEVETYDRELLQRELPIERPVVKSRRSTVRDRPDEAAKGPPQTARARLFGGAQVEYSGFRRLEETEALAETALPGPARPRPAFVPPSDEFSDKKDTDEFEGLGIS